MKKNELDPSNEPTTEFKRNKNYQIGDWIVEHYTVPLPTEEEEGPAKLDPANSHDWIKVTSNETEDVEKTVSKRRNRRPLKASSFTKILAHGKSVAPPRTMSEGKFEGKNQTSNLDGLSGVSGYSGVQGFSKNHPKTYSKVATFGIMGHTGSELKVAPVAYSPHYSLDDDFPAKCQPARFDDGTSILSNRKINSIDMVKTNKPDPKDDTPLL